MKTQTDKVRAGSTPKAWAIFFTLRMNLAMLNSFLRKSFLNPYLAEVEKSDLGFLGIQKKEDQVEMQNQSILTIQFALLHQALENYFEMVKMNPDLKDHDLEFTLEQFGGDDEFIRGMRTLRNRVFHAQTPSSREEKALEAFNNACDEAGGYLEVIRKTQDALYQFTEKCFSGELRIFPS